LLAVSNERAVTVCPLVNFILTYISLVAVSELETVPKVHVLLCAVTAEFKVTTPPSAQPFDPLPPAPAPGTPAPPYAILISIQPLMVEDVSIVLPGNATQSPAIVPVNLMLNFDTEVLANLNVKY
jgi:hypothetical protein